MLSNRSDETGVRAHMLTRLARGHINRMKTGEWQLERVPMPSQSHKATANGWKPVWPGSGPTARRCPLAALSRLMTRLPMGWPATAAFNAPLIST
jgi:hypothetical protein